eukprot:1178901-Prorocentrum_minimum.AAC.3
MHLKIIFNVMKRDSKRGAHQLAKVGLTQSIITSVRANSFHSPSLPTVNPRLSGFTRALCGLYSFRMCGYDANPTARSRLYTYYLNTI